MLTTTIDGLWVLQVLSRIEVLAPELGLRPYMPSVETARTALEHPVAQGLRDAGAISASGEVDETLLEWLRVVAQRDIGLLFYAPSPFQGGNPQRVLLARFAQWWVTLERSDSRVSLADAGIATSEQSAAALISGHIEGLCGAVAPAPFRPVTIDVDELVNTVNDADGLRRFLNDRNLDRDQASVLMSAADTANSAHASFVALQSDYTSPVFRKFAETAVVTVIDTPSGRLVCERVIRGGRRWMIASPGSAGNLASAVLTMIRCLPVRETWHSHRKAV